MPAEAVAALLALFSTTLVCANSLLGWHYTPLPGNDPLFGSIPWSSAVSPSLAPLGGYVPRGFGIGYSTNYRAMTPQEWERRNGRDRPDWRARLVTTRLLEEQEWRRLTGLPPIALPRARRAARR
jgi:hypothetical protein